MRARVIHGVAVAIGAFLSIAATGAGAAEALSGDQIRSLITGNTVSGPAEGLYSFSYMADGTVDGTINADTDDGTWRIKNGNVYCHDWTNFFDGEEHCFNWYPAENGRYLMKNIDVDRSMDLPVWKITKGTN